MAGTGDQFKINVERLKQWLERPWAKTAGRVAAGLLIALAVLVGILAVPYHRLAQRVDAQLAGPLQNTTDYYSASEVVYPGDPMSPAEVASAEKRTAEPVRFELANGHVASIVDVSTGKKLPDYQLEPVLLTNLSDENRAKRMPVTFSEIPPVLVQAIISAEDKRFFQHSGLDTLRIAKAVYVDLKDRRKEQGASTITMQLARNMWLHRNKSWKRKLEEAMITVHLEHKLTKQQIFERYCNLVYLGGDGAFGINGVGEAAQAYFSRDVRNLSLDQAATIAGLIQRPVYFNPFKYPERATDRRNIVLMRMHENGYISDAEYYRAVAAPLGLNAGARQLDESEYFVDAAARQAARDADQVLPHDVYTTLDPRLQNAAERALADGMQLVDKQLAARHKSLAHLPQVALISLDPRTGEVKALCGGRDYTTSQLNRVFAKRPPGSVFKPFVYTAALNTAISGGSRVLTPASMVDDSPTTFEFGTQTYAPADFKNEFMGQVTFRKALAHSLNVAAVKVAEMVGYRNVVALAREAGINDDIQATPAVALGAYQTTPFEIARAYTIFANGGTLVQPSFIEQMRDARGDVIYQSSPDTRRVLDPRVAFLMVDMLQEVMRSGTAAGVRARGFKLPAAGKTGTSHDGWFAGFTSNLLTIVWVGFDDYTDLDLEGAKSALPIWTEFMTLAAQYRQYGDVKPFRPPEGVTQVSIDPQTGNLADPTCGPGVPMYFIDGTQPTTSCMPQEVQINSTPDGGVSEQMAPIQAQPVSSLGSAANLSGTPPVVSPPSQPFAQ